jgi:glycosyltransferase involved in cell wall biosynthesis
MIGKPKIFDEFINTHDYLISEHKKLSEGSFFIKVLDVHMRWIIGRCNHILTDTPAHAKLSSQIYNVKSSKFLVVPVGTDEAIFRPQPKRVNKRFTVLFYGTMLPLHGMEFILDAVKILKQNNQLLDTKIVLIGGRGNSKMQTLLQGFIEENSLKKNIKLIDWVDYQKLPQHIAAADICLGGPFGATGQASRVVTGKTYQFLAMAKPTIIGQIDGVPEFKDKINCLLVQRGNAASLAEAIAWASNHQKELTAISRAGRKLYEEEFSLKKISEELVKIL